MKSKKLQKDVFGTQPKAKELIGKLEEMLWQFWWVKITQNLNELKSEVILNTKETKKELKKLKKEVTLTTIKKEFDLNTFALQRLNSFQNKSISPLMKVKHI